MSGKSLQLEGLKAYVDQQNPLGAKEYIDNVVNFFDCPLTPAELGKQTKFQSTHSVSHLYSSSP